MSQVEQILSTAPKETGEFEFTEFTVTAQVSAKGGLMLMGAGGEVTAGGGLTFKFVRK